MSMKRKRLDGSIKLNSTIEKVFRKYGESDDTSTGLVNRDPIKVGRKQKRRDKKRHKKENKLKHFQFLSKNKSNTEQNNQKVTLESTIKSNETNKPVKSNETNKPEKKKRKIETEKTRQKKSLARDNAADDKVITSLEKKLYLNKRKNTKKLPKSFTDAGLDYILGALDNGGENSEDEMIAEEEDDFFTDEINNNEQEMNLSDQENEDSDLEKDDNSRLEEAESEKKLEKDDESQPEEADFDETLEESDNDNSQDDFNMIAGDSETTNTGKYIPPAMRVKLSQEQEQNIQKLKRKVKGLFNRLSDANMSNICNDIEMLFREGSRAIMYKVLTDVVMDQFSAADPVPDSLINETAMLVSIISTRVGIESLMHFYETTSTKLNSIILAKDNVHGKAANNLLKVLGCLYQLKRIDCKVILDIFRILISSFTEKDMELVLDILNKVGFQLRKDDPESLKDIIKAINSKCEELNVSMDDGSRMSFMLNILMAVKNNNIRKVTGFDPDAVSKMRKKFAALTKNSTGDSSSDTVPPVKLQDFLDAETNGRWWIVGSSFAGRPMLDKTGNKQNENEIKIDFSVSKNIADAAKRQRMNTDVRRNIFYAVMTADDFVDAYEKVLKCGLKGKQLREIPNVIVDCCQQEKLFNPYYLHLLDRFCQNDRQFGISLQCTFWDKFKAIDSLKQSQMNNIVELLSRLIIMETLSLSCLKAIDFTEIDKPMIRFLRLFLCLVAEKASSEDHLKTIFEKLRTSKNKLVKQGVNLFLQYFMLSDGQFITEHSSLNERFQIMLSSLGKSHQTFL
ncbi:nucleolar MIF4G domain-containing protein 1-like [Styela clava]